MTEIKHTSGCIFLVDPSKECNCGALKRAQTATAPVMNPIPIPVWMESLSKDKTAKAKKIVAPEKGEETVLAELADSAAWKYLKNFIESRQRLFSELLADRIAAGTYDMQEIGFRYLVYAQVKDAYQEIITRVENLGEFVEKSPPEAPADEGSDESE